MSPEYPKTLPESSPLGLLIPPQKKQEYAISYRLATTEAMHLATAKSIQEALYLLRKP